MVKKTKLKKYIIVFLQYGGRVRITPNLTYAKSNKEINRLKKFGYRKGNSPHSLNHGEYFRKRVE